MEDAMQGGASAQDLLQQHGGRPAAPRGGGGATGRAHFNISPQLAVALQILLGSSVGHASVAVAMS